MGRDALKETWDLEDAVSLCTEIERIAPEYGAHVALTGGVLYKGDGRKDLDLLFYTIRQWDMIDIQGLLHALGQLGLEMTDQFGWVQKAKWGNRSLDLFFPEAYPASSVPEPNRGGGY